MGVTLQLKAIELHLHSSADTITAMTKAVKCVMCIEDYRKKTLAEKHNNHKLMGCNDLGLESGGGMGHNIPVVAIQTNNYSG